MRSTEAAAEPDNTRQRDTGVGLGGRVARWHAQKKEGLQQSQIRVQMRRMFVFLMVFCVFCAYAAAQNVVYLPVAIETRHTLRDHDLKGQVAFVEAAYTTAAQATEEGEAIFENSDQYYFNASGLLTKSLHHSHSEALQDTFSMQYWYEYDAAGRLTHIYLDGAPQWVHTYNAAGNLEESQQTMLSHHSQAGAEELAGAVKRITYAYNDQAQVQELRAYNLKNKLVTKGEYHYDRQGRVERVLGYVCSGAKQCTLQSDILYEYDAQGNLSKEEGSGLINYHISYQYDGANRLTNRLSAYDDVPNGAVAEHFEYDDKGYLVIISSRSNDPVAGLQETVTEYKHDAQGNWTEMRTGGAGIYYLHRREIRYY